MTPPDLAAEVERLAAEVARLRLEVAADRGLTRDDAGEPYPWTVAGWRRHGCGWEHDAADAGRDWWGAIHAGEGTCAGCLDGMEQAMRALGLDVPWLPPT